MVKENEFSRLIKIETIDRKGTKQEIRADADECRALAARFDLVAIDGLHADVTVTRYEDKITYHVNGTLYADVVQACVAGGEDVRGHIEQEFEAWFIDREGVASFRRAQRLKENEDTGRETEMTEEKDDPEIIQGGVIDIGEIAAQFLSLSLDPYPHRDEAGHRDHIENDGGKPSPFAALAALKKDD